ncbi:MAG: Protein of unknown function (DUF2910) [Methanobacterium sp. Maddingley MBC34]|nr:MAG: Protein of unknown function (DUF2910) [Methanobacterium sp. Maddingley MBC34]
MSDFSTLLLEVIPLALVASISPTTFAVMVFSLSLSKKPKTSGIGFLTGSLIVILVAVLLGFLAVDGASIATGGDNTIFQGWINIVLSGVLIFFSIKTLVKKDNKIGNIENFKNNRSESSEFIASFLLAMGLFSMNFITTVLVVYASSEIAMSSVNWTGKTISLISLVILTLLLVEIPVLICYIKPLKADEILSRLNKWIQRNGYYLTAGLLFILGMYLLSNGLEKLGWI